MTFSNRPPSIHDNILRSPEFHIHSDDRPELWLLSPGGTSTPSIDAPLPDIGAAVWDDVGVFTFIGGHYFQPPIAQSISARAATWIQMSSSLYPPRHLTALHQKGSLYSRTACFQPSDRRIYLVTETGQIVGSDTCPRRETDPTSASHQPPCTPPSRVISMTPIAMQSQTNLSMTCCNSFVSTRPHQWPRRNPDQM